MNAQYLAGSLMVSLLLLSGAATAQESEYVVVGVHLDNVREQKNIFTTAEECANNPACVALMNAAENYFQVPVGKVVSGLATLAADNQGEGTYMHFALPPGYQYCKAKMTMGSIVPHVGPRGSLFLGRAEQRGLYVETWTPVNQMFAGGSWVEADLTIVGVRDDLAASSYENGGSCINPISDAGMRHLFYCRGGGCVDTDDEGQNVDASSPPDENSAK